MKKLFSILSGFTLVAMAPLANAIVITITPNLTLTPEPAPGIQQHDQGPCVIGDPSCNSNDTIDPGFTIFPAGGNVGSYDDIYSPLYSVGDFREAAGNMFRIGIDINQQGNGNSPHLLKSFVALVDGVQVYAFSSAAGADLTAGNNNGNGYSDWYLSGFDLSGFSASQTLQFGVDMDDVDAGRDQFFVISGPLSVPEPGTLGILGLGLLGVGLMRRRNKE